MLVDLLTVFHNATTLIFGVFISAAFLGIKMCRRNIFTLLGFCAFVGTILMVLYKSFGTEIAEKIYPLVIHIPLCILICVFYKKKIFHTVSSITTAYLFCQISNWFGLAAMQLFEYEAVYYSTRIAVTSIVFLLLLNNISDISAWILQKDTKSLFVIGFVPTIYYILDYVTEVYTNLSFAKSEATVEFMGFIMCIAYTIFLFTYFKQYEKNYAAEQQNIIMNMKQLQLKKEMEVVARSQHQTAVLRHDLRHFLINTLSFIENGETENAKAYINKIVESTKKTEPIKYCKNEIVNIILSFYAEKMKNSVNFEYKIQIPDDLPFSDIDITSILSNALENALEATLGLEKEKRYIEFEMFTKDNKYLISVKNTYYHSPQFENQLPKTNNIGHGIGTQSIKYTVDKLNGNYLFTIDGNMFVVQIIL